MRHLITINQKAIIDGNHNIDLYDCLILDFIIGWTAFRNSEKRLFEGIMFVWAAKPLILSQLPMLRCWDTKESRWVQWKLDTLHKRLKRLEDNGYIEVLNQNRKTFIAVTDKTNSLYGLPVNESQMQESDQDLNLDLNPSLKDEIGFKSNLNLDLNPTYNIVEYSNVKESACVHVCANNTETNISQVLQPNHEKNNSEQTQTGSLKCLPPPPTYKVERGKAITGKGVTITLDQFNAFTAKFGQIPEEPSFSWWFKVYGVNAGQMACENQWSQHTDHWQELAWHTVMSLHFRPSEMKHVPKPENYLRHRQFRDDIIDRRDTIKATSIEAQKVQDNAPQRTNTAFKFNPK